MSADGVSEWSSRERRIKRWFAAIAFLFPLQYWFVFCVTEPYPALKLPSFEGARVADQGQFVIEYGAVQFHFADGSSRSVSMRTLFAEVPASQFNSLARTGLRSKPNGPRPTNLWATSGWKRYIPWGLFPGYKLTKERRFYWDGVAESTARWLQERAHALFPSQTATKATVHWYKEEFLWRRQSVSRKQDRIETLEVEL